MFGNVAEDGFELLWVRVWGPHHLSVHHYRGGTLPWGRGTLGMERRGEGAI